MKYIVTFRCNFEKVALIKAIRCFGPYGLKKAKDIIEERVGYDSSYYPGGTREFQFLMDETHLGYYYARLFNKEYDQNKPAFVVDVAPVKDCWVDLTEHDPSRF